MKTKNDMAIRKAIRLAIKYLDREARSLAHYRHDAERGIPDAQAPWKRRQEAMQAISILSALEPHAEILRQLVQGQEPLF